MSVVDLRGAAHVRRQNNTRHTTEHRTPQLKSVNGENFTRGAR
jgi:hypothetical protein